MRPLHYLAVVFTTIAVSSQEKLDGTIYDVFTDEKTIYASQENVELRNKLNVDREFMQAQFEKVKRKLDKQLQVIRERGSDIIPTTTFQRIRNNGGKIPDGVAEKARERMRSFYHPVYFTSTNN